MKFKYNGTDERVFPSLGITVKPNDEFDAPENFSAPDVVASTKSFIKATETKPTEPKSAASDTTLGE